jgi:hypothetical protein
MTIPPPPMLDSLVHCSQSAFIKGRYIQDNLRFVQASARLLHARWRPSLLLKIDISRAFNSVSWSFLLEMLRRVGFDTAWCDWILVLISTTSTRVLLNGDSGSWICHARGLRQGDPLSSMLFLLIMEAL